MIAVLDTSVIVSALLSPSGPLAGIVQRWELHAFVVAVSSSLITECQRVLGDPRVARYLKWSEETISSFVRRNASAAILVEPGMSLEVIGEDPTDNRVLECAITGNAAYIVTRDKHLLCIKEYRGIIMLPPAGFMVFLNSQGRLARS